MSFIKGDRVRVVAYANQGTKDSWVGLTGTVVRVPGEEATPGLGLGPSSTYALQFDTRYGTFAPFTDEELEATA